MDYLSVDYMRMIHYSASGNDLDKLLSEINNHLNDIFDWLCCNRLTLNLGKTKYVIFQPRQKVNDNLYSPLVQYMVMVRASPRCPWSATFPKMIECFVEKTNTLNNKRYRDLLISILSYDEVSAFLLWVKARN